MRQARHGTPGAYGAVVVALAALAGCFDDKGLGIEVDVGDTHASKIELYLGKVACNAADNDAGIDCSSIAPPDGTVAPPTGTVALGGDIWFRDSPLPYTADVEGKTRSEERRVGKEGRSRWSPH